MGNLVGKKLLVLGGGAAAYPVVKTAKDMGLYVISVDYLDGGSAKEIADEAHKISTTDYDSLLALIKEKGIDGVYCGASEFNIQNMIKLTHMAGLPCYCNAEQWGIMQNKVNYKQTCRKYGVPVVPEYSSDTDPLEISYPVIVKPTDGSSSRGLSLVKSAEELPKAIKYAKEYSVEKKVIIEKYMNCNDIAALYTIQDGVPSLTRILDRFSFPNRDGISTITSCLLYPSVYLDRFMKEVHPHICEMIRGIGIQNGVMDFQIFVDDSSFYAFECGLRIPGNYDYPTIERFNGINYLKMMIEYAVSGSMGDIKSVELNDASFHGHYAANLAIMLKDGQIGNIEGIQKINSNEKIISMNAVSYNLGDVVKPEYIGTLSQTYTRFHMIGDDLTDLVNTIKFIFKELSITDSNGNDMLYGRFDADRLIDWVNEH